MSSTRLKAALLASTMGVLLTLSPAASFAQAPAPIPGATAPIQASAAMPSLAPIVKRVLPAVVNVSVNLKEDAVAEDDEDSGPGGQRPIPGFPGSPFDELLKRFFEEQGMPDGARPGPKRQFGERVALGSGFIIDPSGYVVTNNPVVGNAGKVTVIFQDESKHPATIVGRDEKTDLALLKIETSKPLPYVQWGNSNDTQVGDWIVAVGNPFGLGGTVTAGIVSARGRDIHSGPFDDFLQLDAPINRGNSGGPTFDMSGNVIGINTAIYSPSGGSVGIGFAIPSNMAQQVVAQLKEQGKVSRGYLGVQIQTITPDIARGLGLNPDDPHGALVADVTAGSPAAKAGIKQGDVITRFNGHEIDKMHDLPRLVAEAGIGKTIDLTVRRNGQEQRLGATLAELKDQQKVARTESGQEDDQGQAHPQRSSALGLRLGALDERARQRLRLGEDVTGVLVAGVRPDSPLAEAGVQAGDVIVAVNQQPVSSPTEAAKRLRDAQSDKHVLLLLNHGGSNRYVGLALDNKNQG
jgi:serine protease Do